MLFLSSSPAVGQMPAGSGGMGQDGMVQMMGMMQQVGGMMMQMADTMASGQMGPDRMKQMGQMMSQMSGMMERMAEMQKRVSGVMGSR